MDRTRYLTTCSRRLDAEITPLQTLHNTLQSKLGKLEDQNKPYEEYFKANKGAASHNYNQQVRERNKIMEEINSISKDYSSVKAKLDVLLEQKRAYDIMLGKVKVRTRSRSR